MLLLACAAILPVSAKVTNKYIAYKATEEITIDGLANEACWATATWDTFSYELFPDVALPPADDFFGKYKIVWAGSKIFIYIEITDDILNADDEPLGNYWNDDCVEVFIDEDHSGGKHEHGQCTNCAYNAFAYHIDAVTGDAVDHVENGQPNFFNDNVEVVTLNDGNFYTWEIAITIYDDSYVYGQANTPVTLSKDKTMGFMMAYCENDTKADGRENFVGTQEGGLDGWLDASLFGELILMEGADEIKPSADVPPQVDGDLYSIAFNNMYFEADASFGGRISSFKLNDKELLFDNRNYSDPILWGSTLWDSPQSAWGWPPAKTLDSEPYTASISENKIIMVSNTSTKKQLEI
ncbi:MAG: hypothetical protein HC896_00600 [Bacteroidales bacterium]|nr:hypothetical protein [Bacteroidales bacterium]